MLRSPTPFPYVGSYALLEHEGEYQLARIQMRREGEVVVSLPLKEGAGGNHRVSSDRLLDPTPLTSAEAREFHDLDRALLGRTVRTAKQKRDATRRDALKMRIIIGPIADRMMRFIPSSQRWAA